MGRVEDHIEVVLLRSDEAPPVPPGPPGRSASRRRWEAVTAVLAALVVVLGWPVTFDRPEPEVEALPAMALGAGTCPPATGVRLWCSFLPGHPCCPAAPAGRHTVEGGGELGAATGWPHDASFDQAA